MSALSYPISAPCRSGYAGVKFASVIPVETPLVIPAKAGIQEYEVGYVWTPACAGVTNCEA